MSQGRGVTATVPAAAARGIRVSRSARSDSVRVLALGILSTIVGIPASILIARALGPTGKGVVMLATTVAGYSTTLLGLGVEVSLVHFAGRRPESAPTLARLALRLGALLGVIAALAGITLLLTVYRDRIPASTVPWAVFLIALGPVWIVTSYLQNIVTGIGRLVEISAVQLSNTVLTLAGAVLVFAGGLGASAWLAVLGGVFIVSALLTALIARRAHVLPSSAAGIHGRYAEVLRYGLRAYAGTLLQGLNYRLDFFLVAFFLPISQVGLYSIAVTATEMLWVVPNNLGTVLMQRAASLSGHDSDRLTRAMTRLTSLFLLAACVLLAAVALPLITLVFGSAFRGAVQPLLLLLPGTWALGLWKNLTNDLIGRGHPHAKAISAGVAAGVTALLDVLLIPRYGISGAAVASSASYVVAFLMALSSYRRFTDAGPAALTVPRRGDLALLFSIVRKPRHQPAG
jgi:O-antigen/teichoic acid export membrane protein